MRYLVLCASLLILCACSTVTEYVTRDPRAECENQGSEYVYQAVAHQAQQSCTCTREMKDIDLCSRVGAKVLLSCPTRPVMACIKLRGGIVVPQHEPSTNCTPGIDCPWDQE